jgi:hypothetical protein
MGDKRDNLVDSYFGEFLNDPFRTITLGEGKPDGQRREKGRRLFDVAVGNQAAGRVPAESPAAPAVGNGDRLARTKTEHPLQVMAVLSDQRGRLKVVHEHVGSG